MRKIAGYLTKNRNKKDQKIAQSTYENEYIKQGKTFCRNSKQFLKVSQALYTQDEDITLPYFQMSWKESPQSRYKTNEF